MMNVTPETGSNNSETNDLVNAIRDKGNLLLKEDNIAVMVTAAGLIMISVFAGFMLSPDPIIKQMGLGLTFGVLFDAFIVRMAIVPAVMT
ncbi:MAG: MMPL family transporter [Bacillota bacterium]